VSAFLTGLGIAFGIVAIPCLVWIVGAVFIAWSDSKARTNTTGENSK
jgi:hypothetical protein